MSNISDPKRDPAIVLRETEGAFREHGLKTRMLQTSKTPPDPFDGVIAYLALEHDRKRQILVCLDAQNNLSVRLSATYAGESDDDVINMGDAVQVTYEQSLVGNAKSLVDKALGYAALAQADDPSATSGDIRAALTRIADPLRNSDSFGNPRGSHIACLANTMLRLLERIERLEGEDANR